MIRRILDVIAPRQCQICNNRLAIDEELICAACNMHLPRTLYSANAYDNPMARLFWGQIPIERAAAWFFYESHSEVSKMIYKLKYGDHPEYGYLIGQFLAEDFQCDGFFDAHRYSEAQFVHSKSDTHELVAATWECGECFYIEKSRVGKRQTSAYR